MVALKNFPSIRRELKKQKKKPQDAYTRTFVKERAREMIDAEPRIAKFAQLMSSNDPLEFQE